MHRSFASSSAHTLDKHEGEEAQEVHTQQQGVREDSHQCSHASPSTHHYPPSTPHLNPNSLLILSHQSRGRGVYASRPLPAGTVVEISPVLIFSKGEWEAHGSKTVLDCYTFKWGRMGEMALALGLGSLFNHSASPSVSFRLDRSSHSIRYTLIRDVVAGEELYISYGPWGKQYEDCSSNSDSGDASDYVDHKERELADFLKIGEERSDSDEDTAGQRRRIPRTVVKRTRTRFINANGACSFSASNNGSGSESSVEAAKGRLAVEQFSRTAGGPSPVSNAYLAHSNGNEKEVPPLTISSSRIRTSVESSSSFACSTPLWRLSSLPDPATVPLQLLSCHALLIPPRSSSEIMNFLRKHSASLGRGKVPGSEEDVIRHAKTFMKHPDDGGSLRALLCPAANIEEKELKVLLKEDGLMDDEGTETKLLKLLNVEVASTPAPTKTRATEWSASWPVALRSMANSTMGIPTSSAGTLSQNGSPIIVPSTASAIHASSRPGFIDRKIDSAFWSEKRIQWVIQKLARCVTLAQDARERGEVPVGVHVCPSILATAIASNGGAGLTALSSTSTSSEQFNDLSADAVATVPAVSSSDSLNGGAISPPSSWYGGWDADGIPLPGGEAIEVDAFDTRRSQRNPIKHAVGNAVQRVAELRAFKRGVAPSTAEQQSPVSRGRTHTSEAAWTASQGRNGQTNASPATGFVSNGDCSEVLSRTTLSTASPSLSSSPARPCSPSLPLLLNGQDYLLTSLTLFTTHEPCVYCCMSLVHSRVRTLIFLESSSGAGGCCGSQLPLGKRCNGGLSEEGEGGPYALQEQRGLNHRFEVWKWRGGRARIEEEVWRLRGGREEDMKSLLDLKRWGNLDP